MKKLTLLLFCICLFNAAFAQWAEYLSLSANPDNIPELPGSFGPPRVVDAEFTSETSGMYNISKFKSPSTGSVIWVRATSNAGATSKEGATWNTVYNESGIGMYTGYLHSYKKANTFYHMKLNQGHTYVMKTNNGGKTWSHGVMFSMGLYNDFCAVDNDHLFLLYHTSLASYLMKREGNVVTDRVDSFGNEEAHLMAFPNKDTGYLVTSGITASGDPPNNNYIIYRSVSGGTNFVKVFSDTSINIRKMSFPSAKIGYAAGDSGKVIKTTDAGITWQYLKTNTRQTLWSVYFLNDTVGYVAGDSGLIIKTSDGGATWLRQSTGTKSSFTKVFFVDDSVGYALSGSTLYKTTTTGLRKPELPAQNEVFIYPNPSNGRFHVNAPQLIHSVEAVNALGQKVYSGKGYAEEATIDLSDKPAGIYYLNLQFGDGTTNVAKVVLRN